MTDSLPDPPDLDPAALAASDFTRARRGLEPAEVRATLGRAADALRTWRVRDERHRAELDRLTAELAGARELDESRIVSVLGEQTARIVAAAREAAEEIRSNAEEHAAKLVAETEAEATAAAEALRSEAQTLRDEAASLRDGAVADAERLRADAAADAERLVDDATRRSEEMISASTSVLAERTAEAEEHAAEIEATARAVLEEAHAAAAGVRAAAETDAAETIATAREQGRQMIDEVKAARERMLVDLAERRRSARRQLEGALAGRDRIVEELREAGVRVEQTIAGLDAADGAASDAADRAAAALSDDDELDELREQLAASDPAPEQADLVVSELRAEPGSGGEAGSSDAESSDAGSSDDAAEEADPTPAATGTVVVSESVEVVGVVEVLAVADAVDERAEERPPSGSDDDTRAGDHTDDEGDRTGDEREGDEDGDEREGDGATVHDLFERIRSSELAGDAADGAADGAVDDAAGGDDAASAVDHAEGAAGDPAGGAGVDAATEGDTTSADEAEIDLTDAPDAPTSVEGELFDRRDAVLVPIEKSLSRGLKRLASDEQNQILDRLRRVKRGRPDPVEVLPGTEVDDEAVWVDALSADFVDAVGAGAAFWAEASGASASRLFDDDTTREVLAERVRSFLGLHRAHLERVFSDSEERGEDASELADRVRAAYRDWRSSSLPELAGDLATAGFTHGERQAAGPGTPWRWLVDNGGLPCADGEDNALGGAVACDEPFPTGDVTPPAHPGCRCILVPADR